MPMQVIIDRFLRSSKCKSLNLQTIDKLLLFFLASYMGENEFCFPSYETLMENVSTHRRNNLSDSIKKLKEMNIIFVQKRYCKSNLYTFNMSLITDVIN